MSGELHSLNDLLESNNINISDISYIVNYLINESISPQLAMRRIKSFDMIKTKLEDNKDQETIKLLKEEINKQQEEFNKKLVEKEKSIEMTLKQKEDKLRKEIENTQNELQKILKEKEKLETITDLFDSEREELRKQLEQIGDIKFTQDDDLDPFMTKINILLHDIEKIILQEELLTDILLPIHDTIAIILADPENYSFDIEIYLKSVNELFSKLKKEAKIIEKTPTSYVKPTEKQIKEEIGVDKGFQKVVKTRPVTTSKPLKKKKKVEEKKKVSDKEIQVIDLFLDFVNEADNDKNFQDRVSTVCEMDEAYEFLGSIGLSQVYSFGTKGIEKKEELIKLLKSWKVDGVPR